MRALVVHVLFMFCFGMRWVAGDFLSKGYGKSAHEYCSARESYRVRGIYWGQRLSLQPGYNARHRDDM